MINSLDTYKIAGRNAGRALKRGDGSSYHYWSAYAQRLRLAEAREDQGQARAAYQAGYRESGL